MGPHVSDGESADLTSDVRLCSGLGEAESELIHSNINEYVLRFNVNTDFSSGTTLSSTARQSECNSMTIGL